MEVILFRLLLFPEALIKVFFFTILGWRIALNRTLDCPRYYFPSSEYEKPAVGIITALGSFLFGLLSFWTERIIHC